MMLAERCDLFLAPCAIPFALPWNSGLDVSGRVVGDHVDIQREPHEMAYGVQPIAPSKRRTAFENCEHVLTPDQSHPLAAMLIPKPLQNAPHGALGVGGKLVFERRAVREHRDQSSDRPRSIARHTDIRWWCARRKRGLIRGHEGLAARWSWQFQAGAARLAEIVVRLPIRHKSLDEAQSNLCHGAAPCPIRSQPPVFRRP